MPRYAPVGGNFEIPDQGVAQGVLVDIIELGKVETQFGPKEKVELVFQVAQDGSDGSPLQVSMRETYSMSSKANLRKRLEQGFGKKFSDEEAARVDFDPETSTLIGRNFQISIVHKAGSKGGTFANVAGLMPLARGMQPMSPRDYVRREKKQPEMVGAGVGYEKQAGDPF